MSATRQTTPPRPAPAGATTSAGPPTGLRAWRRPSRRALLIGAAAAALLVVAALALLFGPLLGVRTVQVQGVTGATAAGVRERAASVVGRPLLRVDTTAVARRVLSAGLASVTVRRSWPHALTVNLRSRCTTGMASPSPPSLPHLPECPS